jgi:hypothetical protein
MLRKHVLGEKRWRPTAVQDASRSRKPSPFAPASWTAPALWRFGPGQATCARVRMKRYVFCRNALNRNLVVGQASRRSLTLNFSLEREFCEPHLTHPKVDPFIKDGDRRDACPTPASLQPLELIRTGVATRRPRRWGGKKTARTVKKPPGGGEWEPGISPRRT